MGGSRSHVRTPSFGDSLWGVHSTPQFYPAEDVHQPKKSLKVAKARQTSPHNWKRVVFLKQLDSGLLLVTEPYKINGVPLRRVNQAYVIATSTKVDLGESKDGYMYQVDAKINDAYFAKPTTKSSSTEAEVFEEGKLKAKEAFPEAKSADQKEVDKAVIAAVQKQENLAKYLEATFGLSKGQLPHQMVFQW
ncbi:ribosomal protein L6e-domain-containing protein [Suillus placidus]|uniref:60S ribosomal protein L6 n=1 Tax=Suillus placidus TaxID=48579 RepID=A0A9P6ZMJ4_9AGAM|nr:ribosomal protein L6e-domain-containing protein [Suillus placidus]